MDAAANDTTPRAAPRPRRRRRIVLLLASVLVVLGTAPVLYVSALAQRLPLDQPLAPPARPALVFLAQDGAPFARQGVYKEPPVDVATLPAHVTGAFVAIEDRDFYRHGGADLSGILRAALANTLEGRVVQGGSTITQQLAKTYVGDDRSYGRKLRELAVALAIERRLDKNQILSRYLSAAYFGSGAYGLGAAAHTYFDKAPEELSLSEAAMLAGLLKAPSDLAPTRDLAAAQARGRLVLNAMAEAGLVSPEEAVAASPATLAPTARQAQSAEYFRDWAAGQVDPGPPSYGELAVQTTLDLDLQRKAELAVQNVLKARGGAGRAREAALVAMRPDGSVVAMVGGRSYAASQFNRAVQAHRQPGSSFKLFVYLAALRQGATPDTLVADEPIRVDGWAPKNASDRYQGPMTFRDAFAQSSNVAAVRISETVGREAVLRAARDLGVASELRPLPSLALGANEVTLLEMTSAYAAVASGLYPVTPTAIEGVSNGGGQVLAERDAMLALLNAAAERGAGLGGDLAYPVFGKTGTTQNNRDAWFVGFAGDLVVGVWVGNDDETPMSGVSGRGIPAQIWRAFMVQALPAPPTPIYAPEPVVEEERTPERPRFQLPEWVLGLPGMGRFRGR